MARNDYGLSQDIGAAGRIGVRHNTVRVAELDLVRRQHVARHMAFCFDPHVVQQVGGNAALEFGRSGQTGRYCAHREARGHGGEARDEPFNLEFLGLLRLEFRVFQVFPVNAARGKGRAGRKSVDRDGIAGVYGGPVRLYQRTLSGDYRKAPQRERESGRISRRERRFDNAL